MPLTTALRSRLRGNPMWGDALWMVLLSPLTFFATLSLGIGSPLAALMAGLGFTLPLLWRRSHPEASAAALVAVHVVQLVNYSSPLPANVSALMALYAVSAYGSARRLRWWLGVGVLGAVLGGCRWGWYESVYAAPGVAELTLRCLAWVVSTLALVLAVWFMGQWARQRRITLETLQQRADALEREREQGVLLVAQEERNRLAREMHDIVAHSLSVIVVQSDGAGYLAQHSELGDAEARLTQVVQAIETIGQTARTALGETRRLVGVLRDEGEAVELAPAATLDQIGELVANLQRAGVPASYGVTGDATSHEPLLAGAEMAAYRVVQESLTNVMKHAGPGARVQVELDHSPNGLQVLVSDDGRGPAAGDGLGHGVVGMRERVAAWGGTLWAGPRTGGGFEVRAQLPAAPAPRDARRPGAGEHAGPTTHGPTTHEPTTHGPTTHEPTTHEPTMVLTDEPTTAFATEHTAVLFDEPTTALHNEATLPLHHTHPEETR